MRPAQTNHGSGAGSARRSRGPERAHPDVRARGPQATTWRWRGISRRPLVVVEAFLDQLLLHRSPVGVEAGELEVLLVFEVDRVLPAPVLLDRGDDPVAEPLRLVRVEL